MDVGWEDTPVNSDYACRATAHRFLKKFKGFRSYTLFLSLIFESYALLTPLFQEVTYFYEDCISFLGLHRGG